MHLRTSFWRPSERKNVEGGGNVRSRWFVLNDRGSDSARSPTFNLYSPRPLGTAIRRASEGVKPFPRWLRVSMGCLIPGCGQHIILGIFREKCQRSGFVHCNFRFALVKYLQSFLVLLGVTPNSSPERTDLRASTSLEHPRSNDRAVDSRVAAAGVGHSASR